MRFFWTIFFLFTVVVASAQERPRVAVVLSGGGAKGVAHIGALKVIEQAGIPIDIVVGTSMGAIVGGLYSIGYTPAQLDSLVLAQDWGMLLSDRTPRNNQPFTTKEQGDRYQVTYNFGRQMRGVRGMIRGANLEMLFNDLTAGYHDQTDFSTLPVQFACVAADIVTGDTVVLRDGVLASAMRASMAIPGVFTPVYTEDRVLVDGGILNNFPVDVAVGMGADIVIGVDVQSPLGSKERLMAAPDILAQIVEMSMQRGDYHNNVARSDVYIKVDVEGYSAGSFNTIALDTLIRRGEKSARRQMEPLLSLSEKTRSDAGTRGGYTPLSARGKFKLYDVTFDNLGERQSRWVMRRCRIGLDGETDVKQLNRCVSVLSAATAQSGIYYSLRDTLDGYGLHFSMGETRGNSISAGVSFDTEEIASVVVNGSLRLGKRHNQSASLTARFGKRINIRGEYSLLTSPLSGFRWSYGWTRNNMTINKNGRRETNPLFNEHRAQMSYVNMSFLRQNFRMELGLAYEEFHYLSWLTNYSEELPSVTGDGYTIPLDREHFISYFARLDYENLDSRYFTRRGSAVSIAYDIYTDNFVQYKDLSPFWALSVSWMTAIPLSSRVSLIPSLYGRLLWGTTIPFPKMNMVGGQVFGRYMPQQLPFDGISYVESAPNLFVAARLELREQIFRRNYLTASANYGVAGNYFFDMPVDKRTYFGLSAGWGYDLRNFPIAVSLGWSNITRRVSLYLQAGYSF